MATRSDCRWPAVVAGLPRAGLTGAEIAAAEERTFKLLNSLAAMPQVAGPLTGEMLVAALPPTTKVRKEDVRVFSHGAPVHDPSRLVRTDDATIDDADLQPATGSRPSDAEFRRVTSSGRAAPAEGEQRAVGGDAGLAEEVLRKTAAALPNYDDMRQAQQMQSQPSQLTTREQELRAEWQQRKAPAPAAAPAAASEKRAKHATFSQELLQQSTQAGWADVPSVMARAEAAKQAATNADALQQYPSWRFPTGTTPPPPNQWPSQPEQRRTGRD